MTSGLLHEQVTAGFTRRGRHLVVQQSRRRVGVVPPAAAQVVESGRDPRVQRPRLTETGPVLRFSPCQPVKVVLLVAGPERTSSRQAKTRSD
ncbi:hypothetical protein, partial [uncultured Pseudokineococcus sp.]|uniref:hypothetical protein n=1 Tax=uncultured Pseudokineococcus sp. TaxID=1642928 RepID=UPI002617997A